MDVIKPIHRGLIPQQNAEISNQILSQVHTQGLYEEQVKFGYITEVGGIEDGWEHSKDPDFIDGLWFLVELGAPDKKEDAQRVVVKVRSAESFKTLMASHGSPALLKGEKVRIHHRGNSPDAIEKGRAHVLSENKEGRYSNPDTHSPFDVSVMYGGTAGDPGLRLRAYMGSQYN